MFSIRRLSKSSDQMGVMAGDGNNFLVIFRLKTNPIKKPVLVEDHKLWIITYGERMVLIDQIIFLKCSSNAIRQTVNGWKTISEIR